MTALVLALVGGAPVDARTPSYCAGPGLAVVVNGTNDDPPPDTAPALARYQRQGYRAHTLWYPATVWPLGSSSYDDNVRFAVPRLGQLIAWHTTACPGRKLALIGFSQGSRIIGDVVSALGNGRPVQTMYGPRRLSVPAGDLRVELFADPRRDPIRGRPGAGIETLFPDLVVYPGLTMTGPRSGGFGTLRRRVVEVCIVNDPICDSIRPASDPELAAALIVGVFRFSLLHTHYGPDPGRPMAVDPWPRAVDGTWMAPPPPLS